MKNQKTQLKSKITKIVIYVILAFVLIVGLIIAGLACYGIIKTPAEALS